MKSKNDTKVVKTFKLTAKTDEEIRKLANSRGISSSELIREFVTEGLGLASNVQSIDMIRTMINEELEKVIEPKMTRIIKLLMKVGIMSSTFSYFTSKLIKAFIPFKEKTTHDEFMAVARKEAIAYFSLKDAQIDEIAKEVNNGKGE